VQPRIDTALEVGPREKLGQAWAKFFHANGIPGLRMRTQSLSTLIERERVAWLCQGNMLDTCIYNNCCFYIWLLCIYKMYIVKASLILIAIYIINGIIWKYIVVKCVG
jgi:hypothetical protein